MTASPLLLAPLVGTAAPGAAQSEALQQLLQPPWSTILIIVGAFFGLWTLYLFLPLITRGLRMTLNVLGRRGDGRTLGWIAAVVLTGAALTASIQIIFARTDPELQYYVMTASQLVVVVGLVLMVVAFITWLTMSVFHLVGQPLMARRYVLFIGWNFLRSHREIKHQIRAYEGGRKPALWKLVFGAAALGALAWGSTLVPWPRYIGDLDVGVAVFRWAFVLLAAFLITWPLRRVQAPGHIDRVDRIETGSKNLPNVLTVTANTFISIVGVGVGVWALVVVLSVMAGFENDLRGKILATNPHVVIQDDAPMEGISDFHRVLKDVHDIDGVVDAIPYVQGDVIITSRENRNVSLTLRGIDPTDIAASEHHLHSELVTGSLENLLRPERLVPSARWLLRHTNVNDDLDSPGLDLQFDDGFDSAPKPSSGDSAPKPGSDDSAPERDREPEAGRESDTIEPTPAPGSAPPEPPQPSGDTEPPQPSGDTEPAEPSREPNPTEPNPTEPNPAEPNPVEPSAVEPADSEPNIEPTPIEPSIEPTPIDPTPIDPTPIGGRIAPTPIPGVDNGNAQPIDEGIRPGILLGQELATSLRVDVGSEVTVVSPRDDAGFLGVQPRARTFRVAGIFHTGMYEFDLKLAYIAISEAQRFFHLGPDVNRIELRLENVDDSDTVVAALQPIIAHQTSLSAVDWKRLNKNLFSALQLEKIVMFVVLGFIIFVASLNVVGSLAMIIIEKSREIAILKSMGATRREIFGTFMFLGTVIGGIGSAAGLLVGLMTCWFIQYVGIQLPRQYYIDKLPVHIDPWTVGTVFLSGIALCVLATVYPAMEAEGIEPVEGLRFE